jgi:hypothetical protein
LRDRLRPSPATESEPHDCRELSGTVGEYCRFRYKRCAGRLMSAGSGSTAGGTRRRGGCLPCTVGSCCARVTRRIALRAAREAVALTFCPQEAVNSLSFQQHSRFERLSIFVFIDIPASFLHFLKLLPRRGRRQTMTCCRFGKNDRAVVPGVPTVMAGQPDIVL